jgi:BirA family biotin operon repressor/biotin-[acetyl-CoA-carboxylase] ligase
MVTCVPGGRARSELAAGLGARFSDVRWVAETGSTNADVMALARDGAPQGIVLVADHQTAGRGRAGRSWVAPAESSLLMSVLLRPPARVMGLATMATAVAASEALEQIAGFAPRLKWPNDLVWPGDGTGPDRKLAGVLAEADWPAGSTADAGHREPSPDQPAVVVVGMGINVSWPDDLPDELAEIAVACNHISSTPIDREGLLIAVLQRLDEHYERLVTGAREPLLREWRARSATLGRQVRAQMGTHDVEGVAADITTEGHLIIETIDGPRRIAAGDVVHLRPL